VSTLDASVSPVSAHSPLDIGAVLGSKPVRLRAGPGALRRATPGPDRIDSAEAWPPAAPICPRAQA